MSKLIAVFGATGTQGGSVARALLNDTRSFRVRAVTRTPNSEKAQELAELGAEVVQGNYDDPTSLTEALSDCYGVFGVTDRSFDQTARGKEAEQGKALVDACKEAGIQHLVFSLFQKMEIPNLDDKAEIEEYMFESGVPCTSVHYPFYMENLLQGEFKIKEQHDGSYSLGIPMDGVPLGLLAAKESGIAVAAIFRCPDRYYGRTIAFSGDKKTVKAMSRILNKHLPSKTFRPSLIPLEQFARMGYPGAEDHAAMFAFLKQGSKDLTRDLNLTRHLDPGTKTFEEWVVENKDVIEASLRED